MQEFILKNLMTIIFLIILLYGFMRGFATGFVKRVLSFGTIIVTIILTKNLTPSVVSMVKDITNIESTLTSMIYDALMNTNIYDSINIPFVNNTIGTGNIDVTLKDTLCASAANAIISIACGILVFIVTMLVLRLIIKLLDVIDFIPVVGQLNKLLGGVLGVCEVLLIIWIVFTVLHALENLPQIKVVIDNIKGSLIVGPIYDNNPVYDFLSNLFTGNAV